MEGRDYERAIVEAAEAWYSELVHLGYYSEKDPATDSSHLRSDRWPPEIKLAAAVEAWRKYLSEHDA